jgi:hypothetical protein
MILNFALLLQFLWQERALKILELNVDSKRLKIDIQAGTDGLTGAILRLCGLDTKAGYTVDATGCRRTGNGFVSVSRTFAPLYNLSTAVYFLVKPLKALLVGLVCSVTALRSLYYVIFDRQETNVFSLISLCLYGTIAFFCLWKFFAGDRTAVLGVITNAGTSVSITLKVKPADFRDLQRAIAILETIVARAIGGAAASSPAAGNFSAGHSSKNEDLDDLEDADDHFEPPESEHDEKPYPLPEDRAVPEEKRVIQCPHCSANLRLNASILGSRIRCPACEEPFVAK